MPLGPCDVAALLKEETMKIRDGFVMREVAGQHVVIATGEASKGFNGMVKLNNTGAAIWQGLSEGLGEAEITARLVTDFDVEEARASNDVAAFVKQMAEQGFLA